jgi:hypothetical protein
MFKQENGITLAKVSKLQNWDQNPRDVEKEDFERLLKQIMLGEHSTLLVTKDGIVLGGNTRLKAYKKLKKEWAKVIVVDIQTGKDGKVHAFIDGEEAGKTFDTVEQAHLEYALSHNDAIGSTNEGKLAELLHVTALSTEIYKVPMNLVPVEDIAFASGPSNPQERDEDEGDIDTDRVDTYMNGNIKQIVLYFDNAQYEAVMERVEALREKHDIANNTELFLAMLEHFEQV